MTMSAPTLASPLSSSPSSQHGAGALVADRYRLKRFLQQGGMGEVWEAEHVLLGREVALKLLHRDVAENHTARARFEREARVAASIRHPHVVEVVDLGEADLGGVRLPFLAMELLRGEDLEASLERGERFDVEGALRWLAPVSSALDALHALGIVHRDVKPSNLFLAQTGYGAMVKLVDFGVVSVRDAAEKLTRAGILLGTPHYLPPEACEGAMSDATGDVYALACVAYEMLAGVPPHDADTPMGVMTAKVLDDPAPLSSHAPHLPTELDAIFAAALSRVPAERPESAGAFVRQLARHR